MECNQNYSRVLLKGLNTLREQNHLCDIIIKVGQRSFHAHKVVLASASSYFKAMFTSGFKETSEGEISIDGSPMAFEVLLQFAYTGRLNADRLLRQHHMYHIFEMSCYMQFVEFSKTCAESITEFVQCKATENLFVSDAIKISLLARNHGYKELVEVCDKYLEDNVEVLKDSEGFLHNASVPFLLQFLCREDLASESQEKHVSIAL